MDFFDQIVSRVVSFPVQSYEKNSFTIHNFFKENKLFELSVLISSRSLYNDIHKGKLDKTRLPLEKYFSRAHTNPVPFGTFSSVGCLEWGESDTIVKSGSLTLKVDLDNFFISNLLNLKLKEDWQSHKFHTNPSIHFLNNNKISFYKTDIQASGAFDTNFVELDFDENIEWLINRFSAGAYIKEIQAELLSEGFEIDEINMFLLQLIHAGLIINNAIFQPYNSKVSAVDAISSDLVKKKIHNLDFKGINNFISDYIAQEQGIETADIASRQIHSVTAFDALEGSVSPAVMAKIRKYIDFTITHNKNYKPVNDKIKQFGYIFYHSFEDGFIPINKVFNPYSGLKYSSVKQKQELRFPEKIVEKIVCGSGFSNNDIILDNLPGNADYSNLPATFGVIFEILKNNSNGQEIIYFKSLGGVTAINMLTRFSHLTNRLCNSISAFEEKVNEGKLLAEINMIPQSRAVNIFSDRQYYPHSISFNTIAGDNSIALSDIYMRFNGDTFDVISKEHGKILIPRLTSAVDYSSSNSEIYRFLCDLQFQDGEIYSVGFDFNNYPGILIPFIPRVYLDHDILLSPAQLLLTSADLSFAEFGKSLHLLLDKYSMTTKLCIPDSKGDIIINVDNDEHLKYLYDEVKKKKLLYAAEYLYDSFQPVVTDSTLENNYAHEFLVSIKNTHYKPGLPIPAGKIVFHKSQRTSDWLYIELYCNPYAETDVIKEVYKNIVCEYDVTKFFFVRYNHPLNHLRVRFLLGDEAHRKEIITFIDLLRSKMLIRQYCIVPYDQELHRYGGKILMELTESLFDTDTHDTIQNNILREGKDISEFVLSVVKIKRYYDLFNLSLDEMILHCELNIAAFSREFRLDVNLKKSLAKDYAGIKNTFEDVAGPGLISGIDVKPIVKELEHNGLSMGSYLSDVIHMSMNRLFSEQQRFKEFKTYYLAKKYFKQLNHRKDEQN